MKSFMRNAFLLFMIGAAVTGSIYKLIYNPEQENVLKLILINIVMIVLGFLFSFLGARADKNNQRKPNI